MNISATLLQPFLTYVTASQTTFAINTESTYDWEANKWSVPVNFTVAQLFKAGNQIFQVGGGIRCWAQSPKSGPDDWGFRLQLTLLFPKK